MSKPNSTLTQELAAACVTTIKALEWSNITSQLLSTPKSLKNVSELWEVLPYSFAAAIHSYSLQLRDPESMRAFLEATHKVLLDLPHLKITLAYDPSFEQLQEIQEYLSNWLDQVLILDVQYSPQIIGGIIIENGEKRLDCSLAYSLSQFQ